MPDAFDLEERIARWRQELDATLAFSADEIDELEDHLRFSYEAKLGGHAAPEIAWQLATSNLGPASALAGEFAKEKLMPALGRLVVSWWKPALLAFLFGNTVYFFGQEMGSSSFAKALISLAIAFLATLFLLPGKALKNAVLVGVGGAFSLIPILHLFFYNGITDRLIGPGWGDMARSFGWLPVSLGLIGVVLLPTWWRFRHPPPLEKFSVMTSIAAALLLLLALSPFVSEATCHLSLRELYTLPDATQIPFTGDARIKYLNWKFVDLLIGSVYLTAGILPLVLLAVGSLLASIQQIVSRSRPSNDSLIRTIFPSIPDLPWILAFASTGLAWVFSHFTEISFGVSARQTAATIGQARPAYGGMETLVLISAVLYLICGHELAKRMQQASSVRLFYSCLPVFIGIFVAVGLPLLMSFFELGASQRRPEVSDEPVCFFWLLESLVILLTARHALILWGKYHRREYETSLCPYNGTDLVAFGLLTGLIIACSGLCFWMVALMLADESIVMINALLAWGKSVHESTPFHPEAYFPHEPLFSWLAASAIYLSACLVLGLATVIIASALEFIRFNGFRLYRVRKAQRDAMISLAVEN